VFIGESQTGVRQSFSLTMMFFCLGIQPMLQRMERAILTLQEGFHSPLPAGVVAYAADIYACISDLALAPRSILVGYIYIDNNGPEAIQLRSSCTTRPEASWGGCEAFWWQHQ
jgi:hypothetical protein